MEPMILLTSCSKGCSMIRTSRGALFLMPQVGQAASGALSHYGRTTESSDYGRPHPNKKTDLRFAKRGLRCACSPHGAEPHAKGESVHGYRTICRS